jgi:DNA (cytosine-5)-methyltransferase 1
MPSTENQRNTSRRYGSLFAGVGGADLGFDAAGWHCGWQVEIDKHCQTILDRAWPDVPKYGDICEVSGTDLAPVDVIVGGSPCTDLSVAGRRAGLEGDASGLWWEMHRIIKEMRDATNGAFPRFVVWENVPGALTSNEGRDFGTILDSLADLGALAIEWRAVDAQHFGPPQRRKRVFVVACFDPGTATGFPLLADTEGSGGDSGPHKGQGSDGPADADVRAGMDCIAIHLTQTPINGRVSPSLSAQAAIGVFAPPGPLRRLTPLEWERLMGWPDNHTAGVPDRQRYQMCGNGVSAPVAKWIASRLL